MAILCLAFGSDLIRNVRVYLTVPTINMYIITVATNFDIGLYSEMYEFSPFFTSRFFNIHFNIIMPLTWFISSGFPNKIYYKFNVSGSLRSYRPLEHARYLLTLHGTFLFHPPYSSDLAPSDFHIFTHLKQFWGGTRVSSYEVKKTV
jgi:hypothetical protein